MLKKAALYFNTAKYLKPVQIMYQTKNRVFRSQGAWRTEHKNFKKEASVFLPELDEDPKYLARFHVEKLSDGEAELLHESHKIVCSTEQGYGKFSSGSQANAEVPSPQGDRWNIPTASHLWNFNLHYLEFLIPLAVTFAKTKNQKYLEGWQRYVSSWMANTEADAFHPYTISLRVVNLLVCMEVIGDALDPDIKSRVIDSIYNQYKYLCDHQELALLGNHYFENLKAIIICSRLFGEDEVFKNTWKDFAAQLNEQILPDGLHFERSLMYHKLILEDMLRIYRVVGKSEREELKLFISRAATALASIELNFSRTPLFNDAGDNVAKPAGALIKAVENELNLIIKAGQREFAYAGYYRLESGRASLLFDAGEIGPSYIPGHSHNDCLSFEMSVNGRMALVNSGTYAYQSDRRGFFRSCAAHNTVMVDDHEQNELWGEHRAGRRMRKVRARQEGNAVAGSFTSYQGDQITRRIAEKDAGFLITDRAKRKGFHTLRQFFHFAPGIEPEWNGNKVVTDALTLAVGKGSAVIIHKDGDIMFDNSSADIHEDRDITFYSDEFGRMQQKKVLEVQTPFKDEIKRKVRIQIRG